MGISNEDVKIKSDGYNFHFRVVALIIQNDKFLIQKIEGKDYYVLPGGHVELGETSIDALEREIKEEVRCDIDTKHCKFFCFHENLYNKNGKVEHWIENYYAVTPKNPLPSNNWNIEENDKGEMKLLHFKWVDKEELKELDLKPVAIKKLLIDNKINEFSHIIDSI